MTVKFASFVPDYDPATNELVITAPDGSGVRAEIALGQPIEANFWGHHKAPAREVDGP